MSDDPPAGYVTSAEARRRLGISDRTLRRRVQAGTLDGEYVPRPQGSVLYVKLPAEQAAGQAAPDKNRQNLTDSDTASETVPNVARLRVESDPSQDAAQAALAALVLERLDAAQAALLAATERAARAEAERDAARQRGEETARRLAQAEAELARLRAKAERPWWKWW